MRPTKYCDEMIKAADYYLKNYEQLGDAMPQIAGLAVYLDVSRETVYDWSKQDDKTEFSDIVEKILSSQELVLLNKGLKGEFNASITKLALCKHGYSDSQNIAHNVEGVSFNTNYGDSDKTD